MKLYFCNLLKGYLEKLYTSLLVSSTTVSSTPEAMAESRLRIRKWKSRLERDKNDRPSETVHIADH